MGKWNTRDGKVTYLYFVFLEFVATASDHLLHGASVNVLAYHLEVGQVVLVYVLLDKPRYLSKKNISLKVFLQKL